MGRAGAAPETNVEACYANARFLAHYERGNTIHVEPMIAEMVASQPAARFWQLVLAWIQTDNGRGDDALAGLDASGCADPSEFPRDLLLSSRLIVLGNVAHRLGERARAGKVYERLVPYARQFDWNGSVSYGPIDLTLGLLADTCRHRATAEVHFADSAAASERIGAPTWLARTRLEWARMLLTRAGRGDGERAHDLLRQALDTAHELGLANVERDAAALLA